jgi:hypothetical protein
VYFSFETVTLLLFLQLFHIHNKPNLFHKYCKELFSLQLNRIVASTSTKMPRTVGKSQKKGHETSGEQSETPQRIPKKTPRKAPVQSTPRSRRSSAGTGQVSKLVNSSGF